MSTAAATRSCKCCEVEHDTRQGQKWEPGPGPPNWPCPTPRRSRNLAARPRRRPTQQHRCRNAKQLGAAWRHAPRAGRQATWYSAAPQRGSPSDTGRPCAGPSTARTCERPPGSPRISAPHRSPRPAPPPRQERGHLRARPAPAAPRPPASAGLPAVHMLALQAAGVAWRTGTPQESGRSAPNSSSSSVSAQ